MIPVPLLPAVAVANTFVQRHAFDGSIDHLKLQKLSYFAYGWWLALRPYKAPLINSRPQVWKYGPVFQPIYSAFSKYKDTQITAMAQVNPGQPPYAIDAQQHTDESNILEWIWSRYGDYSGLQLSDMTHQPDTPWYAKARANNFSIAPYTEFTDDEIRAYFDRLGRQQGFIQ